ncbi:hypothetical protein LJC40_02635 [Synergistaceae bacterium OttesenSCG-928-D05]|nr:hypothetical protein [Synergistaceae bacterium OttesenSCG-928-D05]
MKQRKLLALALAALFVVACAGFAAAGELQKDADGYYQIGSSADLVEFRELINTGTEKGANGKLTKNIDLEGTDWNPIGTYVVDSAVKNYYSGTFDGNGFQIENLSVVSSDINSAAIYLGANNNRYVAAGLFGVLDTAAVVKNLALTDPEVGTTRGLNSGSSAGALAGVNMGLIEHAQVLGGVVDTDQDAGGIVGVNYGTVTDSIVRGIERIAATSQGSGGIVGKNERGGKVTRCTADAIVSIVNSAMGAGGIAGQNFRDGGTLAYCTVTGEMEIKGTGNDTSVGGIVGFNEGAVLNCAVDGEATITAPGKNAWVGGVVGWSQMGTTQGCTVSGVSVSGGSDAGGVMGVASSGAVIQNCTMSDITVNANLYAGGLVGRLGSNAVLENSVASDSVIFAAGTGGVHSGALVAFTSSTLRNCVAVDFDAKSISAVSSGGTAYAGGVLGFSSDDKLIENCLYPTGIVDTDDIYSAPNEWAVGNISPDIVAASYDQVISYDADEDIGNLPAIVAFIEQGLSVTIGKGLSYILDTTTLPGTLGIENITFAWKTENADIVTVTPDESGMVATLTGVEFGFADVVCEVRGAISADLTCHVTVTDVLEIVPDTLALKQGVSVDENCSITIPDGMGALLKLDMVAAFDEEAVGLEAQLVRDAEGNFTVVRVFGTPKVGGVFLISLTVELDSDKKFAGCITLQIEGEPGPDPERHKSSNCAVLPGAAFGLALLILPFVRRRK